MAPRFVLVLVCGDHDTGDEPPRVKALGTYQEEQGAEDARMYADARLINLGFTPLGEGQYAYDAPEAYAEFTGDRVSLSVVSLRKFDMPIADRVMATLSELMLE